MGKTWSAGDKVNASDLNGVINLAGMIAPYGGSSAPTGWLLCDGSAVSRTTYSDLFAIVGTKYGTGDGSTTFNLPNLKGRVPVGLDGSISDFDDRGKTGGEKTHTLIEAEMPAHVHGITTYNGGSATEIGRSFNSSAGTKNTDSTGGGGAHENMPPYVIVNYIIKT